VVSPFPLAFHKRTAVTIPCQHIPAAAPTAVNFCDVIIDPSHLRGILRIPQFHGRSGLCNPQNYGRCSFLAVAASSFAPFKYCPIVSARIPTGLQDQRTPDTKRQVWQLPTHHKKKLPTQAMCRARAQIASQLHWIMVELRENDAHELAKARQASGGLPPELAGQLDHVGSVWKVRWWLSAGLALVLRRDPDELLLFPPAHLAHSSIQRILPVF
jgi:hypothetical protein